MGVYDQLNQLNHKPANPPSSQDEPENEVPKQPHSEVDDTVVSRHHDTMIPRHHDIMHDALIPDIRHAVKQLGKEAATHRFTAAEKKALAELIFTYRNLGVRTSENEIARIAINFLLLDHKQNKDKSVLHQILIALHQ